jgi:hypothetical protein
VNRRRKRQVPAMDAAGKSSRDRFKDQAKAMSKLGTDTGNENASERDAVRPRH